MPRRQRRFADRNVEAMASVRRSFPPGLPGFQELVIDGETGLLVSPAILLVTEALQSCSVIANASAVRLCRAARIEQHPNRTHCRAVAEIISGRRVAASDIELRVCVA